ncbi:hypothetical protein ECG_06107 [Echinococcus granulosus]|uniref:Zf-LSD1 domain-containing protein n=1 Tax=Echinococcus granulosus TaxID=6210 RepID=U6FR62_ECHGR|nr:hypothetical protein ECG_06107 [Echinococcus granulosus]CDI70138.1 hypothetical protein EgrG_002065100 [Echinococcus granulosus]
MQADDEVYYSDEGNRRMATCSARSIDMHCQACRTNPVPPVQALTCIHCPIHVDLLAVAPPSRSCLCMPSKRCSSSAYSILVPSHRFSFSITAT